MAVGGKCGKFSGSSVGYLAGGGWQTFHCIGDEQARDRGTSVIGRTLPSTLSCSLRPHLKSLELELRQRVTEGRAATHQKKNINYTCTPGPLFLPPRPPWRRAHSCLRGHIWLVVIRAFVASQANIAITCFLWVKSSNMPYESYWDLAKMGPLQTKILTQMCSFKFLGFKSN